MTRHFYLTGHSTIIQTTAHVKTIFENVFSEYLKVKAYFLYINSSQVKVIGLEVTYENQPWTFFTTSTFCLYKLVYCFGLI